jgi:SAM-dependent methyltransferase
MSKAEFDAVADDYLDMHRKNIAASGDDPEYFARYKIADIAADRIRRGLTNDSALTIIDFGSGIGAAVPHLKTFFPKARIIAVDVSARSLEINQSMNGAAADYKTYDGERLPLEDCAVDFALAACVFHHIPHDDHVRLIGEMKRVLKPSGDFYIFEHNPWNPITRHAVNTCPFDENAVLITGPKMARRMGDAGLRVTGPVYRYFFPAILSQLRPAERWLAGLPIGAQYFVRGCNLS